MRQTPISSRPQSNSYAQDVTQFMSRVYLWMTFGLVLSGSIAYYIYSNPNMLANLLSNKMLFYGLIIAQLVCVIAFSAIQQKCTASTAIALYLGYSILTGITFSLIFVMYQQTTIAEAFFTTAGAFFCLSIFGFTTKKDLGPIGSFCMMGLFGLIIISLLALFIPSFRNSTMQMTMGALGVLIFSGLTAYDTQKIKNQYASMQFHRNSTAAAVSGALTLYLDFINLFLSLLRLFGGGRK